MKQIKGIKRNIWVFGIVSLLNDITSEAITPLLPVFLVNYLGASPEILGLIEGIAKATSNLTQPIFGYFSDKIRKRKPFVEWGYTISVIGRGIIALSLAWPLVLVGRFVDRLGKGMRTPARDAMIAEFSARERRGLAFGIHRAMDTAGAVLGPVLAYLILPHLPGLVPMFNSIIPGLNELNVLFLLMLIPAVLAIPLVYLFVQETEFRKGKQSRGILTPRFKRFVFTIAFFNLANFPIAFVLLRANELGLNLGSTLLVYILFNISYVIFALPSGALIDKISGKNTLALSFLVLAGSALLFAQVHSLTWFILGIITFSLFYALYETSTRAVTSLISTQEKLGSSYGILDLSLGLANLASGVLMGIVWTTFGPEFAFYAVSGIALVSLPLLVFWVD